MTREGKWQAIRAYRVLWGRGQEESVNSPDWETPTLLCLMKIHTHSASVLGGIWAQKFSGGEVRSCNDPLMGKHSTGPIRLRARQIGSSQEVTLHSSPLPVSILSEIG